MDGIGTKWKAGITEAINRLAIGSIIMSQRVTSDMHRAQIAEGAKAKIQAVCPEFVGERKLLICIKSQFSKLW